MAFNLEDKVTYKELAPSLQQLIISKADLDDFNATDTKVTKLVAQLGSNRITIAPSGPNSPKNDKEILLNTTNNLFYSYSGGWNPMGGVYS